MLKYDPTLLFYLLPQTQSFALVIMVFAIYLLIYSMIECSDRMAILAGFTLGILSQYHLISAFPIFLLVGCFTLYKIKEEGVLKRSTIILGIAIIITSLQIFSLSSGAGSQISIDHHPGILYTAVVSMGVLIPFSVVGAVKSLEVPKARGILILSVILIVILSDKAHDPSSLRSFAGQARLATKSPDCPKATDTRNLTPETRPRTRVRFADAVRGKHPKPFRWPRPRPLC